jgi:hypothetical protein
MVSGTTGTNEFHPEYMTTKVTTEGCVASPSESESAFEREYDPSPLSKQRPDVHAAKAGSGHWGLPAGADDAGNAVYKDVEVFAFAACEDTLIPRRITPVTQTPGTFFLGWAWGAKTPKSGTFVYGPQVGVETAFLLPIRRPEVVYVSTNSLNGNARGVDRTWSYATPKSIQLRNYSFSLAFSLNANLAAFSFPNAAGPSGTASNQPGFNAGAMIGPQLGWQWWEGGTPKSVMFSFGVLFGYLNTSATGSGFAVGLQPGLVAQF